MLPGLCNLVNQQFQPQINSSAYLSTSNSSSTCPSPNICMSPLSGSQKTTPCLYFAGSKQENIDQEDMVKYIEVGKNALNTSKASSSDSVTSTRYEADGNRFSTPING